MTIFPVIMYPLIGFSNDYQFDNNVSLSKNGPFKDEFANTKNETEQKDNENKIKYCPKCGTKIEKDSQYCNNCGEKL